MICLSMNVITNNCNNLEALPVDDGGAALIVLLLGDPHLLEGGERGQNGSSDPDGVLPLWGSDDLDLDGGRSQGSDLLLHTVSNTGVHGGASRHDSVGVQVLPDVNIALHDGVEGGLVDTTGLHSQEGRLEESLRAPEPLVTDGDDLTVGQLIGLLQGSGSSSSGHLLLEVEGDIAEFLLDVPDNLPLGSGGEGVATLSEDLHQVVGELTSSQVQTDDGVRESVTFIDGDTMGDTVTASMTIPVVRPEAYRDSTAWIATYMAGMLKVSNMIWVIFSLLALGLRGADDPDHVRDLQHARHVRRHPGCALPC